MEAAQESTDSHKILWEEAINDAVEEAKNEMGVEFVEDVDKDAFREATKGMIEDYCERYPGVAELLDIICLLYTSPSPRDSTSSRMPSSA